MVPAIELQYFLVVPRELPRLLRLPKHARARPHERVVELLLVVGPLPPTHVQRSEGLPAQLDALEPTTRGDGLLRPARLQGRQDDPGRVLRRNESLVLVVEALEHVWRAKGRPGA